MGIDEILKTKRGEILALSARWGAHNVRIFGSVARGEEGPESDVDLLVSMEKGRSYFDLVSLWLDLEELLGRKVDVVTDGGLSPYLKDRILGEAIPL
jgi:predicted nucleotidyltransferase